MYKPKYFKPYEFLFSRTAYEKGIVNIPDDWKVFENIFNLASVLDEIRKSYGKPIIVNSGFRSPPLNSILNGSSDNSYHLIGCAVDLSSGDFISLRSVIFDYCNFTYKPGVTHYEDDRYEVIVYPYRKFIHFAVKCFK